MDKTTLTTAMRTSISDVLETMFFLPIEPSEAAKIEDLWPADQAGMLVSRLSFKGPFAGECLLFMPEQLAAAITADFLGQEPDSLTEEQSHGTVKEIINMLVGNTFGLLDPQLVFDLGIPEMVAYNEYYSASADINQEIFMAFDTLENQLAIRMRLHTA